MANFVSQVKLPNNTTYIIRDPNARPLSNNDFDTINVTELNAGDLIVTGVGRFTNGLYGNLIGNADTASSATKATQDESGNNIKSTYAASFSISDHTITLKNKNGTSLGTVTVPDNNTTYTVATGTANGKIKVTPSTGNAYEVSVYGLKSAAYKDVTDTYSETGTDPVSGKAVKAAIDGLPSPMVFRGSLGTGGTITALPVDGTAKVGDTYKVITAGTYASKAAKVGDTFICLTKTSSANTWELIPSGDEPSGTVTSVAISNGGGLSVSGSPITSSGTITISHADTSSQASVNNSGRTYIQDITLDTYGHVTGIASATETVVNTDRYVNSAAFADATSADANNPVKMTLTRAGSDTASVTAYIPKVSSSSAGVAPKGAAVSSQSQSTKFLREDGTWAAPSYTTNTNTTYSLSASGESVVLSGSDNSSSTANLSTAFANYTPYKGNLTSILGSASPASAMKTYWDNNDNIKPTSVNTAYNTAGQEYAFLLSKGNSNQYGAVIRWGYGTKYFEILRKYGSTWKDDDWVKMDAGYADKAGADGDGNTITTTYLPKTTYEWNKEVSFGSSGYLKIGSFAMYDSNVTIEINSTASTTYHGTLVIATQNVTDSSIGSVHVVKVYDDPSGIIANSLRIVWTNGSRNYDIYFVPSNWSKNLVHIQALGLYGYSDICTAQTGTPPTTTTGLEPINVLDSKSAVSGGTDVSMVTTGEKYTWNSYGSGSARDNTKVAKAGDTMSGALTVEASNSYSSYNEGIRINASARTYATLLMGGTNGTTSGTNDGAFWLGVYNTGTTARRLMIAHNGSTNTGTYFYASSSSDISPSLRVGSNLQVANVISANVSNSGTAGGISLYSTDPTSYGIAMRNTTNSGKHGYVQGDWGTYFYMAGATNRGWVFCNAGSGNRMSISNEGHIVTNGSLTLGGNTTNTSGVRQVYNETTKSLDFVFVA